jgi:hypothetical protein
MQHSTTQIILACAETSFAIDLQKIRRPSSRLTIKPCVETVFLNTDVTTCATNKIPAPTQSKMHSHTHRKTSPVDRSTRSDKARCAITSRHS